MICRYEEGLEMSAPSVLNNLVLAIVGVASGLAPAI
jgi:hypothetical protein